MAKVISYKIKVDDKDLKKVDKDIQKINKSLDVTKKIKVDDKDLKRAEKNINNILKDKTLKVRVDDKELKRLATNSKPITLNAKVKVDDKSIKNLNKKIASAGASGNTGLTTVIGGASANSDKLLLSMTSLGALFKANFMSGLPGAFATLVDKASLFKTIITESLLVLKSTALVVAEVGKNAWNSLVKGFQMSVVAVRLLNNHLFNSKGLLNQKLVLFNILKGSALEYGTAMKSALLAENIGLGKIYKQLGRNLLRRIGIVKSTEANTIATLALSAATAVWNKMLMVGRAIMMTMPLLLILGAIVGIVAWVTRSEEGANAVKKVWAGIMVIFDALLDTAIAYAKLLWDIVTFDWDGIKQDLKDMGEAMSVGKHIKEQNELSDAMADMAKQERAWLVEKSELENNIAKARASARDKDTFSAKKREALLRKAMALEKQIADRDVEMAEERYRILKKQNSLATSTADDKKAEAEALAAVNELETRRYNTLRRLTSELVSVTKERRIEEEKVTKEIEKQEKAARREILAIKGIQNEIDKIDTGKLDFSKWSDVEIGKDQVSSAAEIDMQGLDESLANGEISYALYTAKINLIHAKMEEKNASIMNQYFDAKKAKKDGDIKDTKDAADKMAAYWVSYYKGIEKDAANAYKEKGKWIKLEQLLIDNRDLVGWEGGIEQEEANKRQQLVDQMAWELEALGVSEAEKEIIRQKYANKEIELSMMISQRKIDIAQAEKEARLDLMDTYVEGIGVGLGAIADNQNENAKEGFELAKGLRIADTIMNGLAGQIAVFSAPDNVTMAQKIASSIGLGIATIANVAAIRNTQFEGGGSSGAGASVTKVSNTAPVTSGKALYEAGQGKKQMRAYVVMTELEAKTAERGGTRDDAGFAG